MTNYGEFLEKFPPQFEAEILENTSWSCMHGVERWRSRLRSAARAGLPGWNQKWRKPLRESFDWLRGHLISIFEGHGRALLKNPWAAFARRIHRFDFRPVAGRRRRIRMERATERTR